MNGRAARRLRSFARLSRRPVRQLARIWRRLTAKERGRISRIRSYRQGFAAALLLGWKSDPVKLAKPLHRMSQAEWLEGKRHPRGKARR